jgi:ribosomal protein L12E/L44/L45/RPP1/RPP2
MIKEDKVSNSTLSKVAGAISAEVRQIDLQISILHSYEKELDEVLKKTQNSVAGDIASGEIMLAQLASTKEQVQDAISKLAAAKEKLLMIPLVGRR